ncbi:hypothetical protein ACTFIU_002737 [Dictyostelium citrinum]
MASNIVDYYKNYNITNNWTCLYKQLQLIKIQKNVHRLLTRLSKKFGVFRFWSDKKLLFVINEPKVARDILVDNFENFSNSAKIPALIMTIMAVTVVSAMCEFK